MRQEIKLVAEALQTKRLTLVTIWDPVMEIETHGEARLTPGDKFDSQAGLNLAYARALEAYARRVRRLAEGRMKHLEDNRARQVKMAAVQTIESAMKRLREWPACEPGS